MESIFCQASLRAVFFSLLITLPSFGQTAPPPDAFRVLPPPSNGPQITPYLQYQTDMAWQQDEERMAVWRSIRSETELLRLQRDLRRKLLTMMGGLPSVRTPLRARITGTISMNGFHIKKVIFESLPGLYVTALLYLPDDREARKTKKYPAILVPAGHASDGKDHYQSLCQHLVLRGYIVLAWDPVGQGERSQFWDAKTGKSRYNLICAEHAVLGNLAYLVGANLARWEIWDGLRAFDYLLTLPEVDSNRINITGTSGGGFQAIHIAALEPRIKVAAISCYITALPMRIHNRIFKDPDSDPEQDLYGMISNGVDNAGLLALMYPRPVFVAAAVLDFFPIEGAEKTFREVHRLYTRFGHGDRIAMIEGYHGHEYSDANQEAAFEFMDHFNQMPAVRTLAPVQQLDAKQLQCTSTGQVMEDIQGAKPLADFIRDYYTEHKGQPAESIRQLYFGKSYAGIRSWKVVAFNNVAPAAGTIAWQNVGTSTFQDIAIDRYVLHHSHNLVMPLIHIHKATGQSKGWLLWFSKDGKALASDWADIVRQLNAGYDVISLDFRGLGETRMRYKAVSEDDPSLAFTDESQAYANPLSSVLAGYVYNSLLTGRPYFLQMIEDAEIAVRFSREKLHAGSFSIVSDPESTLLGSAIASTLSGVNIDSHPTGDIMKWSEVVLQRRELWPIQYLLPGGAYIQ
jgi:pimeloyl-ACP methyl ester carboxylesterase